MFVGWSRGADAVVDIGQGFALPAFTQVEAVVGRVHGYVADLHELDQAAGEVRIGRDTVDHCLEGAVEVGPPELIALRPVNFITHGVDGDLQRFSTVSRQAADHLLEAGAVQIRAPDTSRLGVSPFGHFGPVELAVGFIHRKVEDQAALAFDEAHAVSGVAQVDALDGVGQAAGRCQLVAVSADIGHRLRGDTGRAVAIFVTACGGDEAALEAGLCTLGNDGGQVFWRDAGSGKAQQRRIDPIAQLLWC